MVSGGAILKGPARLDKSPSTQCVVLPPGKPYRKKETEEGESVGRISRASVRSL